MRKLLSAMVVVFSMGMMGTVFAQDFQKGWKAYEAKDYATALKEWRYLAEQGNAVAQSNLGFMYEDGNGVIQHNVYAHMWYNIAASNGSTNASKWRDELSKKMTAADISKAQELARECVKKEYKSC